MLLATPNDLLFPLIIPEVTFIQLNPVAAANDQPSPTPAIP
jgi:hypothetical protein